MRILVVTLALSTASAVAAADGRNGKLFDTGVTMNERAPGAPPELDAMSYIVGDWNVSLATTAADGETHETAGVAAITLVTTGPGVAPEGLERDLTVLIIAHRLTTVEHCDCIVELEQGRVTAQGSYEQLIKGSESFRRMAHATVGN